MRQNNLKAEYEQYTIDQGREMEALHQQRKAESHALKMRVQDLESSFADAAKAEEARFYRDDYIRNTNIDSSYITEILILIVKNSSNHDQKNSITKNN